MKITKLLCILDFVAAPLRKGKAPFKALSAPGCCVSLLSDNWTILPVLGKYCLTVPLGIESSLGSNNTTLKL